MPTGKRRNSEATRLARFALLRFKKCFALTWFVASSNAKQLLKSTRAILSTGGSVKMSFQVRRRKDWSDVFIELNHLIHF
jgi:hypothetical protein